MSTFHSTSNRQCADQAIERRPASRERIGRGPRIFAPGEMKLLLLALIAEQPCHGYDLIRQVEKLFDGAYSPSPGVIYPTLTYLEEKKMINSEATRGKKKGYSATDVGRRFLEDQALALNEVRGRIEANKGSRRSEEGPAEIREALHNLRQVLHKHQGRWNPQETLRVRELLDDAAKAIIDGR
ncbi:PadR family transcriptional regulator [Pseudomonas sp. T1.Ur]|uniref:PadR family transcriptional regulator n=1 Tax=Pseudomonas sp. T1.Ur TaxID=2928704 RepID=UPI00201D5327|nr:PadR family transcriptional regulator [Pseudomonas sp. T1.Ur]MCL6703592.1 PadR family transcriptional regulator [Pseudomonas sp. T1.Ur]